MQWWVNTGKDDCDKAKENATVETALQNYDKKQITHGTLCQQNLDTKKNFKKEKKNLVSVEFVKENSTKLNF